MILNSIGAIKKEASPWGKNESWCSVAEVAIPFVPDTKVPVRLEFTQSMPDYFAQADAVLQVFFNHPAKLKEKAAQKAFANWQAYNEAVGYLNSIEVYQSQKKRPAWMQRSLDKGLWLEKLKVPAQVWTYLSLQEVVLTRDRFLKDPKLYVLLIFDCAWEEEHGLQMVFENGNRLVRVSDIDGDLTE